MIRCMLLFIFALCGSVGLAQADDRGLFEKARQAHLAGRYQEAQRIYEKIEEQPLREQARCYAADCVARGHTEQPDLAVPAYLAVRAEAQDLAVQAEAALELARILCQLSPPAQRLTEARQQLSHALFCLDNLTRQQVDQTAAIPAPLPELLGSESLLTPAQCRWFLPVLRAEVLRLQLFVLVCLEEREAALTTLKELVTAESKVPRMLAQPPDWSLWGWTTTDAIAASFLVPPNIWRSFTPVHQARLRLACFYAATDHLDLAQPMFQAVYAQSASGKGHANDWAAAELGLAYCEIQQGQLEAAQKRLGQFENILRGTASSRFGRLLLANILAARSATYNKSVQLYGDLVTEPSQEAPTPADAQLAMLMAALNQNDGSTAYKAADDLRNQHAGTFPAALGEQLINAMGNTNTSNPSTRTNTRRPGDSPTPAVSLTWLNATFCLNAMGGNLLATPAVDTLEAPWANACVFDVRIESTAANLAMPRATWRLPVMLPLSPNLLEQRVYAR